MSLDEEVSCKTHPDAPHGFLRNASHNADRYVCECEHWEEHMSTREELVKVVEENESNSRFHNFAEMVCESYQSKMLTDIDAQMLANPELITPADEAQLDRLEELLK